MVKRNVHNNENIPGFEKSPSVFVGTLNQNKKDSTNFPGYWHKTIGISPLITFRIFFGLMLCASIIRFWYKGWIEELYIKPTFFFSYYGFEWIKPLGIYTYLLFAICAISALLVAIGMFYRVASLVLFISFTYIELMDKTTYLNHYYFVSIFAFLMVWLPANAAFSFDAWRKGQSYNYVPRFTIDVLRLMMTILYVYAGLAKLNSDWLLNAQPLKTWLPSKNDLPVLGSLFNETWIAYVFSWFACFYDLTIPFWLSWRKSRSIAFIAVIVFHVLTAILFPIGMFPYIMIVSALIFFPPSFHNRIISFLKSFRGIRLPVEQTRTLIYNIYYLRLLKAGILLFVTIQLILPFRYALYPGELFWTEEGYRFSWRVMLMEKTGYTIFTIHEPATGRKIQADNGRFLTVLQEKQMSFQPDMILEFAHLLAAEYKRQGWIKPAVYAESYVTLNGRPGKLFIDPTVNLANEKESFKQKSWIKKFEDEIQGF